MSTAPPVTASVPEAAAAGRTTWGRLARGVLGRMALLACWCLLAVTGCWLLVRVVGLDMVFPLVQLMAFFPYTVVVPVVLLLATLVTRRWREAALAGIFVLVFVAVLVPRALPDHDADRGEVPLRVLSVNLRANAMTPGQLLDMVRGTRPDLLSLQEITPAFATEMTRTPLAEDLPYSVVRPQELAAGTALLARFPLRDGRGLDQKSTFDMTRATLRVPEVGDVDVTAVHTAAPLSLDNTTKTARDMRLLPDAAGSGPIRLLVGDFNATLDHRSLRELLDTGYRDAAATLGEGFVTTWPQHEHWGGSVLVPSTTIDHVLVDRRAGVSDYRVIDSPASDHRAVFARLTLPAARSSATS